MKSTRSLPGTSNVNLLLQSQGNPYTGRHKIELAEISNALIINIQNKAERV